MKPLQEKPFAFAFVWYLAIQMIVSGALFLLGFLVVSEPCHPAGPGDPCDGPAMVAFAAWTLAIPAGFFAGLAAAGLAFWYVKFAGHQRLSLPSIVEQTRENQS